MTAFDAEQALKNGKAINWSLLDDESLHYLRVCGFKPPKTAEKKEPSKREDPRDF